MSRVDSKENRLHRRGTVRGIGLQRNEVKSSADNGGFRTTLSIELAEYGVNVEFHCVFADAEAVSNRLVGVALNDKRQNTQFPSGHLFRKRARKKALGPIA